MEDVLDALIGHLGLAGDPEEIHDHASRVQANRLFNRLLNHAAEECSRQFFAVNVCDVGAENKRWLWIFPEYVAVVQPGRPSAESHQDWL